MLICFTKQYWQFFSYFQCNNCKQLVIHPDQRFSFFSDYSQIVSCPHCGVQEAHFAKSLPSIFAFIPRRGVTRVNSAWYFNWKPWHVGAWYQQRWRSINPLRTVRPDLPRQIKIKRKDFFKKKTRHCCSSLKTPKTL